MKYPGKESTTLEFKSEIPNKQQILKTIIAFCNGNGGRVVLGVADDGEVIGINENEAENLLDDLTQSIFRSCAPPIMPAVYMQRLGDKVVIIIEVSAGMNKPYFRSAKGLNEGTYIRVGSNTIKASPDLIQELQWRSRGHSVDEMPVYNASLQDLDIQAFADFLKQRKHDFQETDLHMLLEQYKLVIREHNQLYPTKAGILLFGHEPQTFLSEAFIMCSHFKGVSGRDAIASKDCMGNLFQQLKETMAFVTSQLNKKFELKSLKREDILEIPEQAIREAVINAIVHRHYQVNGAIKICIYEDRLEIFSPGSFPGPLQVDQLEAGLTYIRNIIIGRIFREAGYIEKLGSGFLTIFNTYRERNMLPPTVIPGPDFVKVILPRQAAPKSKSVSKLTQTDHVLRMFHIMSTVTASDVAKELDVSRQTAVRVLSKLVEQQRIERIGKGPSTRYRKL